MLNGVYPIKTHCRLRQLTKVEYLHTGSQMRSLPFSFLEKRLFSHRVCRRHSPSSFSIVKNTSMDLSTRMDMAFSVSAEPISYGVVRRTRCRASSAVVVVVDVAFCESRRSRSYSASCAQLNQCHLQLAYRPSDCFGLLFVNNQGSEICAVLGYYASYSGNSLPTFRDNLSVPEERPSHLLRGGNLKSLSGRCILIQKQTMNRIEVEIRYLMSKILYLHLSVHV